MARLNVLPHYSAATHLTRARERDLADLIEDLELAHDCSRSHYIRAAIKAAADYLWQLRCELTSTSPAQGE
jgi:hypothetical protein